MPLTELDVPLADSNETLCVEGTDDFEEDSLGVVAHFSRWMRQLHINVSGGSHVRIGPFFTVVNNTVVRRDDVVTKCLCFELTSTRPPGRLRCSIAICLCWTLIATFVFCFNLYYAMTMTHRRMDLDINETWYIRRGEWQALNASTIRFFTEPAQYVLFECTQEAYCDDRYQCQKIVHAQQALHLDLSLGDITANFIVGGKGWIFEGRGANVIGYLVPPWNEISISIQFLGKYVRGTPGPDDLQYEHINVLLEKLIKVKVLKQDYVIYGHCQLYPATVSPGRSIMTKLMPRFEHWVDTNATKCLPGIA